MMLLKQALGVLGAFVVLAVTAAFIAPKTTHALVAALVQIVPGTTTHVGQNESQLVSLDCFAGNSYCVPQDSSGAFSTTPYVVPSGYTLIVTDWEWSATGGKAVLVPDALVHGTYVLASSRVLADGAGNAFAHEHYVTGIRLGSEAIIYDASASQGYGEAFIQGYLVPND
jgi:hypothetical protein